MPLNSWTSWPLRESLSREGVTDARRWIGRIIRVVLLAVLLWVTMVRSEFHVRGMVIGVAGIVLGVLAFRGFYRLTLRRQLWPSLGLLLAMELGALVLHAAGASLPALVLWCGCAVTAMERLPLGAAVICFATALGAYAAVNNDSWLTTITTTVGLALAGYVMRLDSEARGNAHRLLAQERAARKAEAETAALAERGRIAREIHDVLAHSLSAQLVHLEAARLLIHRSTDLEADRDQILERVVACRGMAREGLDGTREALSALRGEMAPAEDFLRGLTTAEGAQLAVAGERRTLSPEAGLAVRRVAQEALTNVRKHAPGARVNVLLEYAESSVVLEVRNSGGRVKPGELANSGSGYGLLGMRERAELLGGTLESGPGKEGFVVRLQVPA
ncbi:sensor histidine kinase [Streptomyces pinistramenti]|uniref:sensor histidine kinase n=1 Tax=Streptomyces pinistramenti TaxID=2884812 RepID=UPI001D095BA2|nr:histidine kinase [Streptomyces pinistramenti]MCB5906440.1 histidine kinase [Streptomyces pinistramenti]